MPVGAQLTMAENSKGTWRPTGLPIALSVAASNVFKARPATNLHTVHV